MGPLSERMVAAGNSPGPDLRAVAGRADGCRACWHQTSGYRRARAGIMSPWHT